EYVVGILEACCPVAQSLVDCVLQSACTSFDGYNFGAIEFHRKNVGTLAADVHLAHVNSAGQSQLGADSGSCHTVLTGAGFRNYACLAKFFCEQGLAQGIVNLVRSRRRKPLELYVNVSPAQLPAGILRIQ